MTTAENAPNTPTGETVPFDAYRDAWLEDVTNDAPSTVELGHRFARKLLTQWREIGDSGDDLVYCDGGGDGGIDIAYLDRGEEVEGDEASTEGHTWYLAQSKYGTAFRGTGTLLEEAQKVIDTLDGQRPRLSSLAEGLLERLSTFRAQASERDRVVLVFGTERALDAVQKRTLEDVRAMGRQRLGPLFDAESISIETIYQRSLDEAGATAVQLRVPITGSLVFAGNDLLVGTVSLLGLYAFLKQYRLATGDLDQLYEKNVRQFLGGRGRVNRAIQQTLQYFPELFGLYNNGITVVVEDFESSKAGETMLVEPHVVNGCQTTRTIWDVCHTRLEAGGTGSNPEIDAWRERASAGSVVIKVVKVGVGGDDLLRDITRYTNSQNAVLEKDFLALSSDFKVWSHQMGDRHGVFLEIQRGAWESRRAFQQQHPSARPQFSESANAFDLLKVYGSAWLGEAGTAFGKNAPFLPNGSIFKKIVNNSEGTELFGMDDLYAAYRLQVATDTLGFGRGAAKSTRRQTRFLFYLVVGDLLRDVLIRAQVGGAAGPSPKSLTTALLRLCKSGREDAREALLTTALEVVDTYLTPNAEDAVFDEPTFLNAFNSDLNGFLKWEQIGKSESSSPRLRSLLAGYKRSLGFRGGGQPSPRDVITTAVQDS